MLPWTALARLHDSSDWFASAEPVFLAGSLNLLLPVTAFGTITTHVALYTSGTLPMLR